MDLVLVAARVLLAGVFTVAGLAKLGDRAGSRQTLVDFGVPTVLAGPLGIMLPLVELVIAAALIPTATAWWGALGALTLLLTFIAGIGVTLAQGRAPQCRCFGQIAAGPVGRSTIIRNGVLAVVAGIVVWPGPATPGPSLVDWLGELTTVERMSLVLGVTGVGLAAATIVLLVQMLRQQGRLLLRLDTLEQGLTASGAFIPPEAKVPPTGLPVGVPAPTFRLPGLAGAEVSLGELTAAKKPILLVFTDPYCSPCAALMPDVGRWQREAADQLTVAVISRGSTEENRVKAAEHGVAPILLQNAYEVADAYLVYETPSAVLVQADGTIGSAVASGGEQIRSLVAHARGGHSAQPWAGLVPLPMVNGHAHDDHHGAHPDLGHANRRIPSGVVGHGDPAPEFALEDLDGNPLRLADLRGRDTLVLFWNPGCGFCQQLLPELQEWEAHPPAGAPQLLVVSTGSAGENRMPGLRAPVVLDPHFGVGSAFGVDGTPTAVLIDADGKIASGLAIGAPDVLALAHATNEDRPGVAAAFSRADQSQ